MGPLQPHRQLRPLGRALTLIALAACGGRARAIDAAEAPPPDAARTAAVRDAATACAALDPAPRNPVLGALPRTAAPLAGPDLEGGAFDLASLRGKVVLVSFSSSWDHLTKVERPTFASLQSEVGDELAIVRVVSEGTRDDAVNDRRAGDTYSTVFDQDRGDCSPIGAITNSWGVKALPESFLVDRAGNVRFYLINKRDWSTPEALACVRALLADTTPLIAVPPLGAQPPDEACLRSPTPAPTPAPAPAPTPTTAGGELRGTISFARATKAKARPGVIFLLVKQADASGQPTGIPLAVDRLQFDGAPLAFVLDQTKQMVSGPPITGDVVLIARWDQDGDALTKQPGDITGTLRVKAPARGVKLVLDTVLP